MILKTNMPRASIVILVSSTRKHVCVGACQPLCISVCVCVKVVVYDVDLSFVGYSKSK